MALQVEKGVFTANTVTGDQTVSLVDSGLTPKLVILWAAYDTTEEILGADGIFSFGMGTNDSSAIQQAYICLFNDDAAGTSATVHDLNTDAVLKGLTADAIDATATDYECTLVSFGAGQFVINFSNAPGSAIKIHYFVMGGSDISAARLFQFNPTTAVGTQDVTVNAGFGQPDLMIFASHGFTNNFAQDDARLMLGFGNKALEQACMYMDFEDAANNMSLGNWFSAARCILLMTAAIAKDAEGSLSAVNQWPTDGFEITWNDQVALVGAKVLCLAIKGTLLSKIGASEMLTAGSTQDLNLGSGTPKGALLMASEIALTDNTIDSTATDLGGFFVGGTDGTREGGAGFVDDDAVGTSAASRFHTESKALQRHVQGGTGAATLEAEADSSIVGSAVRLTYSNLAAVAADFIWLVVGQAPEALAATPAGVATVSAGLAVKDPLNSTTQGAASVTADLSGTGASVEALAASFVTGAVVSASLQERVSLAGGVQGVAVVSADLRERVTLAAAILGQGVVTADLSGTEGASFNVNTQGVQQPPVFVIWNRDA